MKEGNLKRYMIYASGEVLLVMIGILLALQVNNWNEKRKLRVEEKGALNQIMENLKSEIKGYDSFINYSKPKLDYLNKISQGNSNDISLDSFPLYINHYHDYKPVNTEYIGLRSSGKLIIIKNKNLKEKIIFFYEVRRKILESWSEWQKNFVIEYVEKFLLTETRMDQNYIIKDIKRLENELENESLINLVDYQLAAIKSVSSTLERNKEYAEELINLIENETR